MAIPIDTPTEHSGSGSSNPSQSSSAQHGSTTQLQFPGPSPTGNESFLHQLVLELYSVYYEYCNSAGLQSETLTVPIPNVSGQQFNSAALRQVHDINNNNNSHEQHAPAYGNPGHRTSSETFTSCSRRQRRRHPAGRNGFGEPVSQENITPLVQDANRTSPASYPPSSLPNAQVVSEYELKLTIAENFGVGVQLRQIADIYENGHAQGQIHASRMLSSQKSIQIDATFSTSFEWSSWPVPGVNSASVIGSMLLTSAAAAAIFYLRRS